MPCSWRNKYPLFKHSKSAEWTHWHYEVWEKHADHGSSGIGILLHDMCVVDVDDMDTARRLELEFPVLCDSRVPCETTRRGKHYYFCRSDICDRYGFFDGASQRVKGVDFKTRCHTDARGFVVTAPTHGRSWIRAPWMCPGRPITIPDELLQRVAVPRFPVIGLTVADSAGCVLYIHQSKFFSNSSVVTELLKATIDRKFTLPDDFRISDVIACMNLYDESSAAPLPTQLAGVTSMKLMDFFAVKPVHRTLLPGGPLHAYMHTQRVFPEMARAMILDTYAEISLEEVTPEFLSGTQPTCTITEDWLFADAVSTRFPHPRAVSGTLRVPIQVARILHRHKSNLILAGGAALAAVCHDIQAHDFDLFMITKRPEAARAIVQDIISDPCLLHIVSTQHAATLNVRGTNIIIQVILRRYNAASHVLQSFDLQPCKIMVMSDGETLRAMAMRVWFLSMLTSCAVMTASAWGAASYARVLKYFARGFAVFVPCVHRSSFKHISSDICGIGKLFEYEKRLRRLPSEEDVRIEMKQRVRKRYTLAEYEETKGFFRAAFMYWSAWMRHLGIGGRRYRDYTNIPMARTGSINFQPRDSEWHQLHHDEAWAQSYAELFSDAGVDAGDVRAVMCRIAD
jgi:hypothetical protein